MLGAFVTLLLVPINYLILEDLRRFARNYWNWQWGRESETANETGAPAQAPTSI